MGDRIGELLTECRQGAAPTPAKGRILLVPFRCCPPQSAVWRGHPEVKLEERCWAVGAAHAAVHSKVEGKIFISTLRSPHSTPHVKYTPRSALHGRGTGMPERRAASWDPATVFSLRSHISGSLNRCCFGGFHGWRRACRSSGAVKAAGRQERHGGNVGAI